MKRFLIATPLLFVITLLNFWFYATFKPSDVVLNRLFANVMESPGSDFTPTNSIQYVFYNSFGDFLAVIMVLIGLSLLMKLINFDPSLWLYRFTLIMFLVFETMQLFMPGNFKGVDIASYIIAYILTMPFIAWMDEKPIKGYW